MRKKVLIPLAVILLVLAVVVLSQRKDKQGMISEFGKYQGYSEKVYDGAKRTSDFLPLSDGTRLAYDLFLPTNKGVPTDKPLPVLFKYTPYDRAWTPFDKNGTFILTELGMPWYYGPIVGVRALVMPNGQGKILDALWRTKWLGGYGVLRLRGNRRGSTWNRRLLRYV